MPLIQFRRITGQRLRQLSIVAIQFQTNISAVLSGQTLNFLYIVFLFYSHRIFPEKRAIIFLYAPFLCFQSPRHCVHFKLPDLHLPIPGFFHIIKTDPKLLRLRTFFCQPKPESIFSQLRDPYFFTVHKTGQQSKWYHRNPHRKTHLPSDKKRDAICFHTAPPNTSYYFTSTNSILKFSSLPAIS